MTGPQGDPEPLNPRDSAEITSLFGRACRAWSDGDAVAYGACFSVDCDYVSYDGRWVHGRDAVVEAHDRLFRGVLFGSRLVGEVEAIRLLAPGAAIVHATGSVLVAWRHHLPKGRRTRNTMVAVREAHGWSFAAVHNGRVRPVQVPAPSSGVARLARGLARVGGVVTRGRDADGSRPAAV